MKKRERSAGQFGGCSPAATFATIQRMPSSQLGRSLQASAGGFRFPRIAPPTDGVGRHLEGQQARLREDAKGRLDAWPVVRHARDGTSSGYARAVKHPRRPHVRANAPSARPSTATDPTIGVAIALGVWTAKDLLGHLGAFEVRFADVLAGFVGEPAESQSPISRFRARSTTTRPAIRKDWSIDRVRGEFLDAHERVMRHAAAVAPETWREVGTIPWYGPE
jgi:hypothetical protein